MKRKRVNGIAVIFEQTRLNRFVGIPQLDDTVIPGRGKRRSVGTERQRVDDILMRGGQFMAQLGRGTVHRVKADDARLRRLSAGDGQPITGRVEGQSRDPARLTVNARDDFARGGIDEFDGIAGADGENIALRGVGQRCDRGRGSRSRKAADKDTQRDSKIHGICPTRTLVIHDRPCHT